jgi:hypothetical protein
MIYVGYAPQLADSNTFLRFILNPSRPEGSPVPLEEPKGRSFKKEGRHEKDPLRGR